MTSRRRIEESERNKIDDVLLGHWVSLNSQVEFNVSSPSSTHPSHSYDYYCLLHPSTHLTNNATNISVIPPPLSPQHSQILSLIKWNLFVSYFHFSLPLDLSLEHILLNNRTLQLLFCSIFCQETLVAPTYTTQAYGRSDRFIFTEKALLSVQWENGWELGPSWSFCRTYKFFAFVEIRIRLSSSPKLKHYADHYIPPLLAKFNIHKTDKLNLTWYSMSITDQSKSLQA